METASVWAECLTSEEVSDVTEVPVPVRSVVHKRQVGRGWKFKQVSS